MPTRILCALLLCFCAASAPAGQRFAAIAFHDVADFPGDLDDDAVTVDQLVGFFEWLRANRWTAISLDDLEAARSGRKPLPERAILLTFDDGYRSHYRRVFPLLLAYRMPAVFSLIGSVMGGPMDGTVRYGGRDWPRERFLSWEEAREMAASGLVEFASHGFDLHRGVIANPQGNELAAAWARIYRPGRGYESGPEFRRRLAADLARSQELFVKQLGQKSRVLAWPFGRYNEDGLAVAREAGFRFTLTLDVGPANSGKPMTIARSLPTSRSNLNQIVHELHCDDPLPMARRLVALDPAALWTGDEAEMNERLGRAIERLRTLGATAVVLEAAAAGPDGRLTGAWFPNSQLPVRADILSRIAWQCQSRGSVQAYVRLPAGAALRTLGDSRKVQALFRELGAYVPVSGMFVDDAPGLARLDQPSSGAPWEVSAARRRLIGQVSGESEALALQAFSAVEDSRPNLQLIVLSGPDPSSGPSAIADLTLIPVTASPRTVIRLSSRLETLGWLAPETARRVGLWFTAEHPLNASQLEASARAFQRRGGTAFGWNKDDPVGNRPKAAKAGRTVSAATFPVKF